MNNTINPYSYNRNNIFGDQTTKSKDKKMSFDVAEYNGFYKEKGTSAGYYLGTVGTIGFWDDMITISGNGVGTLKEAPTAYKSKKEQDEKITEKPSYRIPEAMLGFHYRDEAGYDLVSCNVGYLTAPYLKPFSSPLFMFNPYEKPETNKGVRLTFGSEYKLAALDFEGGLPQENNDGWYFNTGIRKTYKIDADQSIRLAHHYRGKKFLEEGSDGNYISENMMAGMAHYQIKNLSGFTLEPSVSYEYSWAGQSRSELTYYEGMRQRYMLDVYYQAKDWTKLTLTGSVGYSHEKYSFDDNDELYAQNQRFMSYAGIKYKFSDNLSGYALGGYNYEKKDKTIMLTVDGADTYEKDKDASYEHADKFSLNFGFTYRLFQ